MNNNEKITFTPLISKKDFVNCVNSLKKKKKLWEKFRDIGGQLSPEFYFDFYPEGDYETTITKLLSLFFPHEIDDIDYFCYELNYGEDYTDDCISVNGTPADISTPAKLYDFLVAQEEEYLTQQQYQQQQGDKNNVR
jgi:hypothetical protein